MLLFAVLLSLRASPDLPQGKNIVDLPRVGEKLEKQPKRFRDISHKKEHSKGYRKCTYRNFNK